MKTLFLSILLCSASMADNILVYGDSQWDNTHSPANTLREYGHTVECFCRGSLQLIQHNPYHWPRPDLGQHLVISLMANDVYFSQALRPVEFYGIDGSWYDVYVAKLDQILEIASNRGARPLFVMPTVPTALNGQAAQVWRFFIWHHLLSNHPNVPIVDPESHVELGPDGLHHSPAGSRTMAEMVDAAL